MSLLPGHSAPPLTEPDHAIARPRLGVETLEDRTVPAIVTWDGAALLDLGRPWRMDYQGGDGNDVAITYLVIAP